MQPEKFTSYYFDNNATTKLLPSVKEKILQVMNLDGGNPSSTHSDSYFSNSIILESRSIISNFLNCDSNNLIFNSGATEGNSTVLLSLLKKKSKTLLITTYTEHASILRVVELLKQNQISIHFLSINEDGLVDASELEQVLNINRNEFEHIYVSIAWANSETGVVQDIPTLTKIAKNRKAYFHTDASQAIGRLMINLREVPLDFLTFTGHKLHAPQGIGCLFFRDKNTVYPLLLGGEQEFGLRAGTENFIYIAALGQSVKERMNNLPTIIEKLKVLRNTFENEIFKNIKDVSINGSYSQRVPNTSNIHFHGIDGRALLAQLDQRNIYCSQTSACTSMIPEPSKTLRAMGLSYDEAFGSLRFSFAIDNSNAQILESIPHIMEAVNHLRDNSIWRSN